jgi:hypothetical protein
MIIGQKSSRLVPVQRHAPCHFARWTGIVAKWYRIANPGPGETSRNDAGHFANSSICHATANHLEWPRARPGGATRLHKIKALPERTRLSYPSYLAVTDNAIPCRPRLLPEMEVPTDCAPVPPSNRGRRHDTFGRKKTRYSVRAFEKQQ